MDRAMLDFQTLRMEGCVAITTSNMGWESADGIPLLVANIGMFCLSYQFLDFDT